MVGIVYVYLFAHLRIEMVTVFFKDISDAGIVVFLHMSKIDGQDIEIQLEKNFQFGGSILFVQTVQLVRGNVF